MRQKNLDLIVVLALVALNCASLLVPTPDVLHIALSLPFVFLLPGYVVTEVLSYKRPLDMTYRVILSIGLSISLDILGGFLLNLFPTGLRAQSWAIFLSLLVVGPSLVLCVLRRSIAVQVGPLRLIKVRPHEYALGLLALLLVIFALLYAIQGVLQQPHPGFTQLWLLPMRTPASCSLRLGVRSFESNSTSYSMTMQENGKQVGTPTLLVLAPLEEWDSSVSLSLRAQESVQVVVLLYRTDNPGNIYREVHVTVHAVQDVQDVQDVQGVQAGNSEAMQCTS